MSTFIKTKNDVKDVFKKCGTCSRTFAHLLNREFTHPKEHEERALNPLAGGIMNRGYQCGMLWGASLAVGGEAFCRNKNLYQANTIAITATQHVMRSFMERSQTTNCKEIIGYDLNSFFGMAKFMLKVTLQGMNNSHCFNLAEQWAPEAIQAAIEGLSDEQAQTTQKPVSCASEVVKNMGGSDEEMVMVAGFAGGLGLSGNACGALSAAIWKKMLDWCRENPKKDPPFFNNPAAKKILKSFNEVTGSDMLCSDICGRQFDNIQDHTEYINNGGCKKLIRVLSES